MRRKSEIENKKEERSTIDTSIKSNQKAYENKPIAWTKRGIKVGMNTTEMKVI